MRFDWDIDKTILWLMPSFLRKIAHWSWLKALLSPVKSKYADFLVYREAQLYESYLTGQTIQLQRILNDKYDPDLRRIIIIHSLDNDIVLFLDEENQPDEDLVFYMDSEGQADTLSLYLDEEAGGVLPVDFRVLVPAGLGSVATLMTQLIRKYALIDKTFDIVFV
jgi:hypothetical protein